MILSFIIAIGTGVYNQTTELCPACFGPGEWIILKTSDALLMDIVMIVMATVILFWGGGVWSLYSFNLNKGN
jgi:hypothetical protein